MDQINENEQWKTDGICEKCKRQSYCSHPCRLNKLRGQRQLEAVKNRILDSILPPNITRRY